MHKVDPEETPVPEAIRMASFLGIDISKETFHASLLGDRGEAKKVFPNTPKGFEQLVAWLKNRHADDVHACMEATGAYWEALAVYLHGLELRGSAQRNCQSWFARACAPEAKPLPPRRQRERAPLSIYDRLQSMCRPGRAPKYRSIKAP
jgi:Transposase